MKKEFIALTLSFMCIFSLIPSKAFANTLIKPRTSGSSTGNNEHIVAHDTLWKYGVVMRTNLGALVDVINGILVISGAGKVSATLGRALATQLGVFALDKIAPFSYIANIKFDRYIVRDGMGRTKYRIYAAYYKPDGSFINAKLVQEVG